MIFYSKQHCDRFINYLEKNEIGYKRYFNIPLKRLPFVSNPECTVAESICSRIVTLPIYYEMKEEEIEYESNTIRQFSLS